MTKSPHVCKYWQPHRGGHRGWRWCDWCGRRQVKVRRAEDLVWEVPMDPKGFAEKWLPAISGTDPKTMMFIQVAFPFEWNCYESWNVVYRVKFQFPSEMLGRLPTRTDIMNGWQSGWHEVFNRIDAEAEAYYTERTGRVYDIGDNTYAEMREIIQSGTGPPPSEPPELRRIK
jgi:hypothetical protein